MTWVIHHGDWVERLCEMPDESVHCVVTSPPYWGLRDYGTAKWEGGDASCDHIAGRFSRGGLSAKQASNSGSNGDEAFRSACGKCGAVRIDRQLGLERTPGEYIAKMVEGFREVRRVLRSDGTLWLNLGDCYATGAGKVGDCPGGGDQGERWKGYRGSRQSGKHQYIEDAVGPMVQPNRLPLPGLKPKDLCMIPARVAIALQTDGWYLRSDIIWAKPNPMPESVTDRPTKAHEYIFLLTKSAAYYYDAEAIKEPLKECSIDRLKQPTFDQQNGGPKDYGHRTNSNRSARKALCNLKEKLVRAEKWGDRYEGWAERDSDIGRNKRSVWEIATAPFSDWTQTSRRVRVEPDAATDDTERITSPNCPLHGDSSVVASSVSCGGRAADSLSHNGHSGSHRASELQGGSAPIAQSHGEDSLAESSDSPAPQCSSPAKRRSNQTRKTGRDLSTNQPCTASAQILSHTQHNGVEPSLSGSVEHSPASNSAAGCGEGEPGLYPSVEIRSCSEGKCTCEYYNTVTEEISHFATFPPKLVEPCILAGTSEKGCCPKCGAPWERITKPGEQPPEPEHRHPEKRLGPHQSGNVGDGNMGFRASKLSGQEMAAWRADHPNITIGWQPSCKCSAGDPVPCTVLDPFCGAGTAGLVALRYQRNFIGIELKQEYCEMARRRIEEDAPLFNGVNA